MPGSHDPEESFRTFEEIGEQQVRENLAAKRYGEWRIPHANEWLRRKEDERANMKRAEEMAIAHTSAKSSIRSADAAEQAAREAQKANTIAEVANALSQEANRHARGANKIAIASLIAALVAILISILGIWLKS